MGWEGPLKGAWADEYFYSDTMIFTEMHKRSLDEASSSGPPAKNVRVQYQSLAVGKVSTLDEMDTKVLKFQNYKLYQVRTKHECRNVGTKFELTHACRI